MYPRPSHARVLLRGLSDAATIALSSPVLVKCNPDDPGVHVPTLVLAALSPNLLQGSLCDVAFDADATVILPEADGKVVARFFGLLGKKGEELDSEETECVLKVIQWLNMDGMKERVEELEVEEDNTCIPRKQKSIPKKRGRKKRPAEEKELPGVDPIVMSYSSFGRARKKAKKFEEEEEEAEERLEQTGEVEDDEDDLQDAETLFERRPIGSGNIACAFCWKKYHHVKARNKHMLVEHTDVRN